MGNCYDGCGDASVVEIPDIPPPSIDHLLRADLRAALQKHGVREENIESACDDLMSLAKRLGSEMRTKRIRPPRSGGRRAGGSSEAELRRRGDYP